MVCEKIKKCPFYLERMPIDSGLGKMYREHYCEQDNSQCARHQVATTLGPEFVPVNLFPNMHDQAKQIIEKNKK